MPSVRWADIPELSARDRRCRPAWQQYWQQSPPDRADPRPSAFQPGHIPSCYRSCECSALSPVAAACRCRCCCCHRCCQLGVGRPVASRPAPCRGWLASGPGRLRPGPWFLTGVSAEAPGSSVVTSRVHSPGTFHLCSLPCGSQSCLMLEGRIRTLSGPSPDPRAARTFVLSVCCVPSPWPISLSCTISSGILCRPGFRRGRSYVPDADPGGLGSLTSQNSSWLAVCRK